MMDHRERVPALYADYDEANRLRTGMGLLEFRHMTELLARYLPAPPARLIDIGGAAGEYTFWMAERGYEAHLLDIVPKHIAEAKRRAAETDCAPAAMVVGDALDMPYGEGVFDGAFMAGPLYHLMERADRMKALQECRRVLRPGGVMVAYGITRYAALLAGLPGGAIYEDAYMEMLRTELRTGYHDSPRMFKAYFHLPEELAAEVEAAGFRVEAVLGAIGPAWMAKDFDAAWADEDRREKILEVARMCEPHPIMSPRTVVVAR